MQDAAGLLDAAGRIVAALTKLGLEPILVGGMALVTLGSRRVTRDFDFVIPIPGDRLEALVDLFYDRGLELAARVNDVGDITATINNRRVANIRLRLDAPSSAYFSHPKTGLVWICCSIFQFQPRNSPRAPPASPSARAVYSSPRRMTC